MMKTLKRMLAALALLAAGPAVLANNLVVTNPVMKGVNASTAAITFDLAWENSWRDEVNHDAAWVFVKFSKDGGATWHHVTLAGSGLNPAGYSAGTAAAEVVVPEDGTGAFIQPAAAGTGPFVSTNVTLVWNFTSNGVAASDLVRIKVMGTEMVYIPEGPFYCGDDSSFWSFYVSHITSGDITKTNGTGEGTLADPYVNTTNGLGRPKGVLGVFTNGYPNGYNAFYLMKYEVSRQQMLDFFNLLPYDAATNLLKSMNNFTFGTRNQAIGGAWPNYTNALPEVGASYYQGQGWPVCFAYLDWAALRPMTELEYEKACRGPMKPCDQDNAWGTPHHLVTWANAVTNLNKTGEAPLDPDVNVLTVAAPPRCGATGRPGSDQFQAGASYYGVMDLSGGCVERLLASGFAGRGGIANAGTRAFDGSHGNGDLHPLGTNNVPNWVNFRVADYCSRGGGADTGWPQWRVADRNRISTDNNYANTPGMRGARTR